MTNKNKAVDFIKEEFAASDHDVNGQGSVLPDPIPTPDNHRPADNVTETDIDMVVIPGFGAVPRQAVVAAIAQKLQGLDGTDLAQIIGQSGIDLAAMPSAGVDAYAQNMASVHGNINEEVNKLFDTEEVLTEEFKKKATVLFEAAVNTKVSELATEQKELVEKDMEDKFSTLTENIVNALDKYTTFVAESFYEKNKQVIEETADTVVAQAFMTEAYGLLEKFNIRVAKKDLDIVGDLNNKIESLSKQLNESIESNATLLSENQQYKRNDYLNKTLDTLTPLQKSKLKSQVEGISYVSNDDFIDKVNILTESVKNSSDKESTLSLLKEGVEDGIPSFDGDVVDIKTKPQLSNKPIFRYL